MNLLSKQAHTAMIILHSKGYEAYAVGGCTRDMLMGRESQDTDITTSMRLTPWADAPEIC